MQASPFREGYPSGIEEETSYAGPPSVGSLATHCRSREGHLTVLLQMPQTHHQEGFVRGQSDPCFSKIDVNKVSVSVLELNLLQGDPSLDSLYFR